MMRIVLAVAFIATASSPYAWGQELPVRRVALFSSGVAYFERDGQVDGTVKIELPFKTAQINDILKSLVLQDLGGGAIRPVVYAPKDPIEKALRAFGIDLTGKPTLGALLDQIRGVPVSVTQTGAGTPILGTILGVEKKRVIVKDQVVEEDVLTIVCEDGIRSFGLPSLSRIKLTDEKLDAELTKALSVLAETHDADKKPVVLEFAGQGQRRVRVSYILEAPIWKTSYRLVLGDGEPFLQGWATVDNTTDGDWNDVELTLVSGRPISFIQDLYQPIYIPRPEVRPELYASLVPRRYGGAIVETEEKLADANERGRRRSVAERLKAAAPTAPGSSGGFGGRDMSTAGIDLAAAGVASLATAVEAGEMFTYPIDTPVTLPRRKSAMLPIVNQSVKGEKFSIFNPGTHPKYPLNGLRLTNATGLHLMQGPVTVFEEDTYAGDAQLPDMTPGEKRLISYSLDLKREVEWIAKPTPEVLTAVRIARGTLIATRKYADERTYNIKNKDQATRAVLIEQPFRSDWKLITPTDPFERTPAVYRFRVDAKGGETTPLVVREERQGEQLVALGNTDMNSIQFYLRAKVISASVREALEEVVRKRNELEQTAAQRRGWEDRVAEINRDQARIRENVKTVRQGTDLYERYITKLEAQETELDQAAATIAQLKERQRQQQEALDAYLLSLNVE